MGSYRSRHACSRRWGIQKRWRGGGWQCRGRWLWSCTSAGLYYCQQYLRGDKHTSHIQLVMERRRLNTFVFNTTKNMKRVHHSARRQYGPFVCLFKLFKKGLLSVLFLKNREIASVLFHPTMNSPLFYPNHGWLILG